MKRVLLSAIFLVILVALIVGHYIIPTEYTAVRDHVPTTHATETLPEAVVRPDSESRATAQ